MAAGFDAARGEFLTFLEAGDRPDPMFAERHLAGRLGRRLVVEDQVGTDATGVHERDLAALDLGGAPQLGISDPVAEGGEYYGPDGFGEARGHPVRVESSARSHDTGLQEALWKASEELTGVTFPV